MICKKRKNQIKLSKWHKSVWVCVCNFNSSRDNNVTLLHTQGLKLMFTQF